MSIYVGRKHRSVSIAKKRLQTLISSDRSGITPIETTMLESELYDVLSKYLSITPDKMQVRISNQEIHIYIAGENN